MEPGTKDFTKYRYYDLLFTLTSIITFVFDVVTDVLLAISYYQNGQFWPAYLTIFIILLSSIVVNTCCLYWFIKDSHLNKSTDKFVWVFHIIIIILQFGPFLNYFYLLYFAYLSIIEASIIKKKYYISRATFYDHDSSLLRIFETFIESSPQLILQIYIFFKCNKCHSLTFFNIEIFYIQIVSILSSWVSIAWSITSYYRILRFSNKFKLNVTIKASLIYFLWKFFSVGCRVIVLASFAIVFPIYFFIFVLVHWLTMSFWIMLQKSQFCHHDQIIKFTDIICEYTYNLLIGIVYIFTFMNVTDGKTRVKLSIFYATLIIEDIVLMTFWYMHSNLTPYMRLGIVFFCIVCLCFDVFFLSIYYIFYHPLKLNTMLLHQHTHCPMEPSSSKEYACNHDVETQNFTNKMDVFVDSVTPKF